jgi:hypothetical protein
MTNLNVLSSDRWKEHEKIFFRFFFIYFIIQAVPLDWKYFRQVFSINWFQLGFDDIFYLTRYAPQFYPGAATFADWAVVALIALVGAIGWALLDKKNTEYNKLYYWLRVILRYRLAIGVIAYGFIKFFPLQSPYPSISNLNTNYGDLSAWKAFSLSLGIVPNYESFLGFVEILAGSLLFFRKTTTIGAFIIVVFTGNVFMSNLAYEGGEYVYSFHLISIALFLLAFDAIRLFNLIGLERPTAPSGFKPSIPDSFKIPRIILKGVFIFFFVFLYGFKTYSSFKKGPYHFPEEPGIVGAAGLYNVSEFTVNNNTLPYSAIDSIRWKDVVFEEWNTISIRSGRPVKIDFSNTEEIFKKDEDRNYELTGSGGRHYYRYDVDSSKQVLTLYNKNKYYQDEKLVLNYSRLNDSTFVLKGLNEKSDSISVVLSKSNKKYLLKESAKGRSRGLSL